MKTVGIIVLNWKQPALTTDTVDSLLKITHPSFAYKIIIVDNGSPDDSVSIFKKTYSTNKYINILETKKNLGYVDGNNYGIKHALKMHFQYILVLNNDVIVKSNFLEKLISFNSTHREYALLSPKIYFAPGHEYHQNRYQTDDLGKVIWSVGGHIDWNNIIGSNIGIDEVDHGQYNKINNDVDFLSGCCLLIDSLVFKKIGLFDSRYFMYLEDADFCRRAISNGFKLVYSPESVIWHINAGSSAAGGHLHDYFLTRNRLLFAISYARVKTKLAIFRESIKTLLFSPSKWQKKGVIDFYINRLGKGSWQ